MTREEAMREMVALAGANDGYISTEEGLVRRWRGTDIKTRYSVYAIDLGGYGESYREAIDDWKSRRESQRQAAIKKLQEMAA